jgi:hypothetical protein
MMRAHVKAFGCFMWSAISTMVSSASISARMQLVRRGGGSDRHALKLRDLALRLVSAQRPSYRDDYLIIEYRPQVDDLPIFFRCSGPAT